MKITAKKFLIAIAVISLACVNRAQSQVGGHYELGQPFNGNQQTSGNNYFFTPDSKRVIYNSSQDDDGGVELYSASASNGERIKLNTPFADFSSGSIVFGSHPGIRYFQISPDGVYIIYSKGQYPLARRQTLFVVRADGSGQPIELGLVATDITTVSKMGFTADSKYAVISMISAFSGASLGDGSIYPYVLDLQALMSNPNNPVQLNTYNNSVLNMNIQASNDNAHMVYVDRNDADKLKRAPFLGGSATVLSESSLSSYSISPDSSSVFYLATDNNLYRVSIGGGGSQRVNALLGVGTKVGEFSYVNNGVGAVFDIQSIAVVPEILAVYHRILSDAAPIKLTPTLAVNEVIAGYKVSADNSAVVYMLRNTSTNIRELYSVTLDGATTVKLNTNLVGSQSVKEFSISPDGSSVVYVADHGIQGINELYHVSIAGGVVIKLNPDFALGQEVITDSQFPTMIITPDNSRVLYRARQDTQDTYDLYSVPLNGGTSIRVNFELPSDGDVYDFTIDANSEFVAWRANDGRIYSRRLQFLTQATTELCLPIVAKDKKAAVICL